MCCVAALAVGCEAHGTCNQELARCDCPNGRGAGAYTRPLFGSTSALSAGLGVHVGFI